MRTAAVEAAKWLQTLRISWSNQLAYKLNFLLLIIGPTIVFFFVKYNLWSSIFAMPGVDAVAGYDLDAMLRYQVWVMVVSFLAQGYNSMNLAVDIRMGRISSYLVYPFEFWKFHTAGFLAFQAIQIIVTAVTVICLLAMGLLSDIDLADLSMGIVYSLAVGLLWFAVSFVLGLIAFWLEETWVLRVLFQIVTQFLSGSIIPLEVYPSWLVDILRFTPFPYMTFVPAKVFMGSYDGSLVLAFLTLGLWTAIAGIVAMALWRRGLRLYTAAGM